MQSRFISKSKNNGRRSTARWWLVGLAFTLAVCLVAGFDLDSKAQASPLLQISTESPTPSPTSTPLVISSADSETMPTWTSTPTPRRPTALAMTLQAQRDLTQTRLPPTPSSIYTLTRTPTITTTYFYKVFPTVTLRKWPTYTFTPRPTSTSIPTQDQQQTLESIHKTLTARSEYYEQFTATAEVGNYILAADVPNTGHKLDPTVVWSASSKMKLGVNTTWLPDGSSLGSGLLFEGGLFDSRKFYTIQLPGGNPVLVDGQSDQLLNEHPPKNNKDNIQPAISPKGDWIAFSSLAVDDRSRHHLFIMSTDPQHPILYQVTKGLYNQELQPTWAPDGKSIIFISVYYYSAQIYKLGVSWLGGSHTAVDMYGASPYIPDYYINIETAPRYCMVKDKPWVVFSKNIGSRQIYVMKADGDTGTNIIQLTKDHGNSFPDWSPDCKKIIYMEDDGATKSIDTLGVKWDSDTGVPSGDGNSPVTLISYQDGGLSSPHYSPDASQVVFAHTYLFVPTPIPTATSP